MLRVGFSYADPCLQSFRLRPSRFGSVLSFRKQFRFILAAVAQACWQTCPFWSYRLPFKFWAGHWIKGISSFFFKIKKHVFKVCMDRRLFYFLGLTLLWRIAVTANLFTAKDAAYHVMLTVNQSVDDDSYLAWYFEKLFYWLVDRILWPIQGWQRCLPWLKAFQRVSLYQNV